MCLINISEKKFAKEEIVVFKVLTESYDFSSLHGKDFSCEIADLFATGKISIYKDRLFFCTNDYHLNGVHCPEKFDFKYSYVLDSLVNLDSLEIDNLKFDIKTLPPTLITYYQKSIVEIGKEYKSTINIAHRSIEEGLHSFKYRDDINLKAFDKSAKIVKTFDKSAKIVQCTIPIGAVYFEGDFNARVSIASNRLRYDKIIS